MEVEKENEEKFNLKTITNLPAYPLLHSAPELSSGIMAI